MPSRGEGLPLAAIEAIGAGVPVIASDVGDIGKVVVEGTSGWLVAAGDLDGFAAHIRDWQQLDENARAALRLETWRHARAQLSEDAGLPDVLAVYKSGQWVVKVRRKLSMKPRISASNSISLSLSPSISRGSRPAKSVGAATARTVVVALPMPRSTMIHSAIAGSVTPLG
jgi:hypothetical protein